MRKTCVRLGLLLASVSLTLLTVELAMRGLGWGGTVEFERNEDWGFLMKPSQRVHVYGHPILINSLGLRGPELLEPKPSRTQRVVFVGDSVTYAGGRIREEQLFCRILEDMARRDGHEVEVVNLSAPAWSPINWQRYIKKRGLHHSDVVVLVLPECDLVRAFRSLEQGGHKTTVPILRIQALVEKAIQTFFGSEPLGAVDMEQAARANVLAVRFLREQCGSLPFLAILVPSHDQTDAEAFWPPFEACLPEALDLRTDLGEEYFFDRVHLSVEGHRFVAERAYPRLRKLLR